VQPFEARILEAFGPLAQMPLGHSRLPLDGGKALALGQQQDRFGPPCQPGGYRRLSRAGAQFFELFGGRSKDRRGFAASHGNLLVHQVRTL